MTLVKVNNEPMCCKQHEDITLEELYHDDEKLEELMEAASKLMDYAMAMKIYKNKENYKPKKHVTPELLTTVYKEIIRQETEDIPGSPL